jgi:transcriptional regulator with XRE-family HTH domain
MERKDITKAVGQAIRKKRVRLHYSQGDLELISDIPKARLSRYENGHVMPDLESLNVIAGALGVKPSKLLSAAGL